MTDNDLIRYSCNMFANHLETGNIHLSAFDVSEIAKAAFESVKKELIHIARVPNNAKVRIERLRKMLNDEE